ncbi:hypothetical protein CDN99_17430 [Roseateles aquatilis]|uniref:Uncharacterized protein n=1 Tax=Roseateles aquatilis TaxID=431061 RepID=A0A246J584_9BURK|nr:hypothetical protein [Roseateles aquatilis]OWQ87682.1 hypothetical protein CDN99_17430 [Roseateles aquatilis]
MTHTLADTIAEVNHVFAPDRREGQVCAFVFHRLSQLHEHFDSVTLGSVAIELGWADDREGATAIARALDYLAYGTVPLLERRFQLWSQHQTGEVLEAPVCELSDADIRSALETQSLIDPSTGESVADFLNRVQVVYVVTPLAHELAAKERADS